MVMKKQRVHDTSIAPAVKEYEAQQAPPSEHNTVNFADLQTTKKETSDIDTRDFDARYPAELKQQVLAQQQSAAAAVSAYDSSGAAGQIQGLYLECAVPS